VAAERRKTSIISQTNTSYDSSAIITVLCHAMSATKALDQGETSASCGLLAVCLSYKYNRAGGVEKMSTVP
jgi:hypothetical protein